MDANSGFINRSIILKESEIGIIKDIGVNSEVIFESFQIAISIRRSLKHKIIYRIIEFEDYIIVVAGTKCKICSNVFNKKILSIGINGLEKIKGFLKGEIEIPIYIKIYGSTVSLKVSERTRAADLCNLITGWMSIEIKAISITIYLMCEY